MLARLLSSTAVSAIAHRGGSSLRPENTLASFDHAATLGVDAMECDVRLARDTVPVVIHDETLERTTDGAGPVASRTADELAQLDAGAHFGADRGFPFRGRGFGVPRLVDVLSRHPTMPFVVEIKGDSLGAVPAILDAVDRAGARDRVIVGAFSHAVLDEIRRRAPDVPTSASGDEIRSAVRRTRVFLRPRSGAYRLLQAPYRYRGRIVFGRRFVAGARRAGLSVHAWIVDEEADMRRLVSWGVTGLISDRPDIAVTVRDTDITRRAEGVPLAAPGGRP